MGRLETFVEGREAFVLEDLSEAVDDASVLWVLGGLVDQSHFDDFEWLHDDDLSPPRDTSACEVFGEIDEGHSQY